MARVLLGLTGSGKSNKFAQEIMSIIDDGSLISDAKIYIIVPDQYTVSTEKFYLDILGEQRFSNVRLMSFKRLANHVFKQVGGRYNCISKCSCNALCAMAVTAAAHDFKYYRNNTSGNNSFGIDVVKRLVDIFSQLKTAGITAEEFSKKAMLINSPRLIDIAAIYSQYQSLFASGLFDSNDIYTKTCELLETENLFSDDFFFIDNFRTVNPGERLIINAICKQTDKVAVALPYTERKTDNLSLLSGIAQSGERLISFLKKNGVGVDIETLSDMPRFINPDIKHLSKYVFSDNPVRFSESVNNIKIYKCADLYDEVEAVASEISRLVNECGYRYSDICVTARDMDVYAPYLSAAFNMYNVPFFAHKKAGMLHMPLVVFISSLLSLATDGYTESSVIALLKTGFLDVDASDSVEFETYLRTWKTAINGIKNEFVYKPSGFGAESPKDADALKAVNGVRAKLVDLVENFKIAAENKTVKEICEQLYSVIKDVGVIKKLSTLQQNFKKIDDRLYSEQVRVYDMLISAMEDLCSVADDIKFSLHDFSRLLMSAIDGEQISIIPTALNEVLTGNINNLPFMSPKCTFVLGMDNTSFPASVNEDPLIRFNDVSLLRNYGIEYGMTDNDYAVLDRYLAYVAVTSPREKLYLSYAADSGKTASSYLKSILSCFSDGVVKEDVSPYISGNGFESRIRNEASAFSVMSRTGSELLQKYLLNIPEYSDLINNPERNRDKLSPETSKSLFGNKIYLSATSVNNFFECRFKYFLEKGMRFPDERSSEFGAIETGNYIHYVFEQIVPQFGQDIKTVEDIKQAVGKITEPYMSKLTGDKQPDSVKSYINILKSQAFRLACMFKDMIDTSEFVPTYFEKKIDSSSPEYSVDGRSIYISGIIDRVDKYEKDGKIYIIVNDYKTGDKKFDLNDIYNGLDIQMLLYLKKILYEMKKNSASDILPAGATYLKARTSIKEVARNNGEEESYKKMKEANLPSGLLLEDADVDSAVGYNKKEIKHLPSDQYEVLFEYVDFLLKRMTEDIVRGEISKNPIDKKDSFDSETLKVCKYCNYAGLCEHYGCSKQFAKPQDVIYSMKQEMEQNA